MPITIAISVASMPTNREIRDPQIRSARIERPFSSVPSGYSDEGGSSTPPVAFVTSMLSGSARSGAKIATRMKNVSSPSPNRPERWLRKLAQVRLAPMTRRCRVTCRGVTAC